MKPKETKLISIGFKQDSAPKNTARMEIVFDAWCYGIFNDESTHLCIRNKSAPEERAQTGR